LANRDQVSSKVQLEEEEPTMTEKFCKDCPCLKLIAQGAATVVNIIEAGQAKFECKLLPIAIRVHTPDLDWCGLGRQIMAEEEAWEKAKESFKEGHKS